MLTQGPLVRAAQFVEDIWPDAALLAISFVLVIYGISPGTDLEFWELRISRVALLIVASLLSLAGLIGKRRRDADVVGLRAAAREASDRSRRALELLLHLLDAELS